MNKSVDWNDTSVLRTLSDGWYTVPLDSEYARSMMRYPREDDTRALAEERYQRGLKMKRSIAENACIWIILQREDFGHVWNVDYV